MLLKTLKLRSILPMLFLGVVMAASAQDNELSREIREFHIKHVVDKQIGTWHDGARSGIIRYSIYRGGHEEVYDALFIQWVQDKSAPMPKDIVVATMRVNLIKGIFKSLDMISDNPYTLRVAVGSINCNAPQDYNVKLLGIDKVEISYLNKDRCENADTSGEYK